MAYILISPNSNSTNKETHLGFLHCESGTKIQIIVIIIIIIIIVIIIIMINFEIKF